MLPVDARWSQIFCLLLFLSLGVATRDWTLKPEIVGLAVLSCIAAQIGWFAAVRQFVKPTESGLSTEPDSFFQALRYSLPSALITSLGLSLLLRTDHYTTMVLASVAAISSKFVLRFNGKHIFNPGNFGIIMALLLTPDAWVSPGQWGEEGWYALLFLCAGGLVVKSVGRWDTTVAFLSTYAGLEALRTLWLGWTWDVWLHRLMSGSLLLFAFFMITDPRTIPDAKIGRLVWAIAIAILTFILRNVYFVSTAPFWALFCLAPLSLVIDWLLPAVRFNWINREVPTCSPALGEPIETLT